MKYVDNTSVLECVAGFYNNPTLFEEGFSVNKEDILNSFHRHIYQAVYNLYKSGVISMNPEVVSNYLKNKPRVYAEFENNKGISFLNDLSSMGNRSTFKYYYNRMKKFTMFRTYYKYGVDLSWLYDDLNILDVKKKEAQDKWLDETAIDKIADIIDQRVEEIKSVIDDCDDEEDMRDCFEGIRNVVKKFQEQPDIGLSLYGKYFNGINYGARLGKFYLTSAASGSGKSRRMIADSCVIGCSSYYDKEKKMWIDCGAPQPVLYTSVEQDLEEIQTMLLCFISGVNENKIRRGGQTPEEAERVNKAMDILEKGKIKVKTMPEFNIVDIENMVKKSIRQFHIKYFFFDYIELNLKIMEEISRKASSLKSMREDNILLIMATKIKDLCRKYNIFFKSSTQVNGEWKNSEHMDQNMISGAKSLCNKIDYGEIMLKVTPADIEKLSPILANGLMPIPKLKIGVYKNRGAEFDDGIIWCNKDLGCCRVDPLFITNYEYQVVEIGQDFFVVSEESVDKELCQDEDEKLERAKQDINNFVVQKYSMVGDSVQFNAYWLPKIQNMIETYLGKGKKVNDAGRGDLDKLLLLAKDIITIE